MIVGYTRTFIGEKRYFLRKAARPFCAARRIRMAEILRGLIEERVRDLEAI
jgi:hypothetical protein